MFELLSSRALRDILGRLVGFIIRGVVCGVNVAFRAFYVLSFTLTNR